MGLCHVGRSRERAPVTCRSKPEIRNEMIDPIYEQTELLAPEGIADGVAYTGTRPRHTAISELWIMPPPIRSCRIRRPAGPSPYTRSRLAGRNPDLSGPCRTQP